MPIREMPKFKSTPNRMLEIPQPAIGGLNLKDMEFEQEVNQSPYMKNMMYRNGAFGKRYGQQIFNTYSVSGRIYSVICFNDEIFAHVGSRIVRGYGSSQTTVATGLSTKKGLFIVFAQKLYYLISDGFYVYNGTNSFSLIDAYVPDLLTNCYPDGSQGGDPVDELNILGNKFRIIFNGEENVNVYEAGVYTKADDVELADWSKTIRIWVEDEELQPSAFTVDTTNKRITFTTAPPEGAMNVIMEFTMVDGLMDEEKNQILNCKFYDTFGGANNSRLFVAGSGNSKYFYSQAYDISYFPENNFATLGNTEDDITGFGRQYNVLIVFKPREIYSIYSYTETSSTTASEEAIGMEAFRSQLVNASIGCDAPYSIQIVNNLLTWFNSKEGICTLVSTNIQDERNVRVISRNIERTNNFGLKGILDINEDPMNIQSVAFNNKYFIVFPTEGLCFMWDYEIVPYRYSSSGSETNPKELDWFLFDHFYVNQFLKYNKELLYASSYPKYSFTKKLIVLNDSLNDLDFNNDGVDDPIDSFYMTPFLQFGAVAYLKTIKNIYIQSRGDTATKMNLYYYTEESTEPEEESEVINVGGRIWNKFLWSGFSWTMLAWGITYRVRCMLKKVQMASFFFTDNSFGRDLSLTHISLEYQVVKTIK